MLKAPWKHAEFCVVDLETTGLDLRRDAIVSYGAVVVSEGRVRVATSAYAIVRPDCAVSVPAVRTHNLRDIDLAEAPRGPEALAGLVEMLKGRILVAHAAWIEHSFLTRALRESRVQLTGPVVDTARLARAAGVGRAAPGHEPPLELVAESLGLEPHGPHHALGDALTTAEVFLVLATRLSSRSAETAGSLAREPVADLPSPREEQLQMLRRLRR
ncbi:MAG TPA: 3'-5' exonuclease [Pseudonocardia sp.]